MGWIVTRRARRLKDVVVALAMLVLALLIVAKLENQQAERHAGPFAVVDGDTLAVDGERLRIEGIDAPELAQACLRADKLSYACGEAARRTLTALAAEGGWECSGSLRDRYDRLLVICKRGLDDLGALLVSSGAAVADGRYLSLEAKARAAGEGIWAGSFQRPSDWRRERKLHEAELAGWLSTLLPRWLTNWFED